MTLADFAPKTAATAVPLHPLLAERWSPRAFDASYALSDHDVTALLEAARWAPSASNTQPWRFCVTLRGTAEHAVVLDALTGGNRVWAPAASALIVAAAETEAPDGAPRPWAGYDTGQAVAHLTVQAAYEGLVVHQMAGFDRDRLASALLAPEAVTPLAVLAVGRRDAARELPEPFAAREIAPRVRLPLDELQLTIRPVASRAA